MEWNDKKQARLDALRTAELAGRLDKAGEAELNALIESLEIEEKDRLSPAMAQMQAEQAMVHQQVQDSEATNEQLAMLAAQQEQLLADSRRLLRDLQSRHQAVREAYRRVTGESLSAAM